MTDEIDDRLDALDGPTMAAERPKDRSRRRMSEPPLELTEAPLEALLFVAERPLSRREIASLAGVDRATVDAAARRPRGHRCAPAVSGCSTDGDRVELATAPEAGALIARYVGADAVRLSPASPRDARDRRLPPASDEGGGRADPRRRLGLHVPLAAASTARRRARPLRRAGPAVPVRDRLRVPRAVRADELDELPPLDVDVAARLAEEGGERR